MGGAADGRWRDSVELFDGVYYHFRPGDCEPSMILARADRGDYAVEIIVKPRVSRTASPDAPIQEAQPIVLTHREKKKRPDDVDDYDEWTWGDDTVLHRDQVGREEPKWSV